MIDTSQLNEADSTLLEAIQQADFLPVDHPVFLVTDFAKDLPLLRHRFKVLARQLDFCPVHVSDSVVALNDTAYYFILMTDFESGPDHEAYYLRRSNGTESDEQVNAAVDVLVQ